MENRTRRSFSDKATHKRPGIHIQWGPSPLSSDLHRQIEPAPEDGLQHKERQQESYQADVLPRSSSQQFVICSEKLQIFFQFHLCIILLKYVI